jgi:hypothetical protein
MPPGVPAIREFAEVSTGEPRLQEVFRSAFILTRIAMVYIILLTLILEFL